MALIVKQGRQIGLTMPFIGCDGWANQALITIGGKAIDGCFFTNHFSPDDQAPLVNSFVAKYQEKYGSLPDTFAALGYDAARLLADAIRRAGALNPQAIRDAIATTTGFPGVTGQISLDANRNASKPGLIVTVKDGGLRLQKKSNLRHSLTNVSFPVPPRIVPSLLRPRSRPRFSLHQQRQS